MTQLSPQAQAVLDAVCDNTEPDCDTQHLIAAALRATADQVVPEFWHEDDDVYSETMQDIRQQLLAIATDLEAQ